jgi:sugar lactone lactonase YvrE
MSASVDVLRADLALDARAALGEGPVWVGDALVWVDIEAGSVHRFDPATGLDQSTSVGTGVGAAAPRRGGGLVLAVREGFAAWRDDELKTIAVVHDDPGLRMNDGKVDPAGRFWAGSMADDEREGAGTLFRLDPDLSVRVMLGGLTISNGMDWSEDARTMYFIDSGAGSVDVLDFDVSSSAIANRRPLTRIPEELGLPDGMTLDAEGCLWVAIWGSGEVWRFAPDEHPLAVVEVPAANPTSCAFGGMDLETLFVTSAADTDNGPAAPPAGGVFSCRPAVRGRLANRFGG